MAMEGEWEESTKRERGEKDWEKLQYFCVIKIVKSRRQKTWQFPFLVFFKNVGVEKEEKHIQQKMDQTLYDI